MAINAWSIKDKMPLIISPFAFIAPLLSSNHQEGQLSDVQHTWVVVGATVASPLAPASFARAASLADAAFPSSTLAILHARNNTFYQAFPQLHYCKR